MNWTQPSSSLVLIVFFAVPFFFGPGETRLFQTWFHVVSFVDFCQVGLRGMVFDPSRVPRLAGNRHVPGRESGGEQRDEVGHQQVLTVVFLQEVETKQ